jgi:hypothetical protein
MGIANAQPILQRIHSAANCGKLAAQRLKRLHRRRRSSIYRPFYGFNPAEIAGCGSILMKGIIYILLLTIGYIWINYNEY